MSDLELGIKLVGDSSGFRGALSLAQGEMKSLGATATQAGGTVQAAERAMGAAAHVQAASARVGSALALNRMGLLSLQASGVNTFQALAAGISPFRVALFEGSQVIGALIQGGVIGFRTLLGPIGLAAAAAGVFVAAIKNARDLTDNAAEAERSYAKALKGTGDILDTVAGKERRLFETRAKAALAAQQATIDRATGIIAQQASGNADGMAGAFGGARSLNDLKKTLDVQIGLSRTRLPGGAGGMTEARAVAIRALEDEILRRNTVIAQQRLQIDLATERSLAIEKQLKIGTSVEDQQRDAAKAAAAEDDRRKAALDDYIAQLRSVGSNPDIMSPDLFPSAAEMARIESRIDAMPARSSAAAREWVNDASAAARRGEEAFTGALDGIGDAFVGMYETGKFNLARLGDAFIEELIRVQARATLSPLAGVFSNALQGVGEYLFGNQAAFAAASDPALGGSPAIFGSFHSGGVAGSEGGRRVLPAWVLDGAPRYHAGMLAPGEVPAILRNDESVLTPGQMRALGARAPTVNIEIVNTTGQPSKAQESRGANGGRDIRIVVGEMVAADLHSGGPVAHAIETRYPISPRLSGR